MAKKQDKTNAVRILESAGVEFSLHSFECQDVPSGQTAADIMGLSHDIVFKTLVTVGKSGVNYVFVIPVDDELDLRRAACAASEKSVAMVKSKELLPLTGYIHGGCSPIGMRKQFTTFIDSAAADKKSIVFSAGRIGLMVEVQFDQLGLALNYSLF